jgi:hypothetical protein
MFAANFIQTDSQWFEKYFDTIEIAIVVAIDPYIIRCRFLENSNAFL